MGKPIVVAGVPPDYFSATGQLWGNPIYRWKEMATRGYAWWVERFRATFHLFDLVRLDHFEASRPIGKFRAARPRPSTAAGCRVLEQMCFGRCAPNWEISRSSPKT